MAAEVGASRTDQFAQAYRALRSSPSVQFNLQPRPPRPEPPAWLKEALEAIGSTLKPVGRLLRWFGSFLPDAPYARILLWVVLLTGALVIAWALYGRIKHGEWPLPRWPREQPVSIEEDEWQPETAGVCSWLDEADTFAAQGMFAEAIHHLLFRSVEDIARRRPQLVRPAITSRELASAEGIPARARTLFSRIAGVVERSLFGGREVSKLEWSEARETYSEFALAGSWRR